MALVKTRITSLYLLHKLHDLFCRNLVVALKELSIRGDFLTTVEYLIKLLETQNFQQNDLDTGWLDMLIADKVCPLFIRRYRFSLENVPTLL